MIAGFATVLGQQARGSVLPEVAQQTKHLAPPQVEQPTGISYPQTTGLNP